MAFTSVSVLSCFEVCRVFDTAFGAELYEKSFIQTLNYTT